MNSDNWLEIGAALLPLLLLAPVLGRYMYGVYEQPHMLPRPLRAMEKLAFRLAGADPGHDMTWKEYAVALLLFNAFGFLAVFTLQMLQAWLPLNPEGLPNA